MLRDRNRIQNQGNRALRAALMQNTNLQALDHSTQSTKVVPGSLENGDDCEAGQAPAEFPESSDSEAQDTGDVANLSFFTRA
mmetsp:Transcript_110530/g.191558  ORF Transcript_110530/g.191558 Transcript_110530/m.191558 type:complete len:82 (+) Transcript_110530:755-1000(+)